MRNIVFMLGCCFVAFQAGVLIYCYQHPSRNIASETAIPITAGELYAHFTIDHAKANALYLNKVIQVSGRVLTIRNSTYGEPIVILQTGNGLLGIACTLYNVVPAAQPVQPGEQITIKGICNGYIKHVRLSRAILIH